MKVYARQVNPEHQESPLFYDEESFPDDIAVFGNRDFNEHLPDVVRRVREVLDAGELANELEYIEKARTFYACYGTATEAITAHLPPEHKDKYSTRDVGELKKAVTGYSEARTGAEEDTALCVALSVVTGQKWESRQICGCCQRDWNTVYYPADNWSREALAAFETEYFNTGSEWFVGETAEDVTNPENLSRCTNLYCTAWSDEGIKKEIANNYGGEPENVTLYKWAGSRSVGIYEEV